MDVETQANKVALVFGGSRGIGAAAVTKLADEGYSVAFTYASQADKANALVEAVVKGRGRACAIQADSADANALQNAVELTAERFGSIKVVVVNAGVLRIGTIDVVPIEDLDLSLNVNVRGVFLAIQATLPYLADGARVITIGSNVAIRTGFRGSSVYQMTKGAVAALVKGVALDLAPRKITVNNIQPGPTDTDINAGSIKALSDRSPLGRVAAPSEIAGLIAYLASDGASYITGASLTIDGGFTL